MGHETVFFSAANANGSGVFPLSIAVMADIHGNDTALERCLTDAEKKGIRNYLFLGDYAGELAHPERVMRLLYGLSDRYSCLFIRGNKENYWLNYRKDGEKGWKEKDSITGCMLYSYRRLTEEDLHFFSRLEPMRQIVIPGLPPFVACHGSPKRINQKMLPDDPDTLSLMEESPCSLILCAHTHVQRKIKHRGVTILNPGSVGVPLFPADSACSGGRTQYLILHAVPDSSDPAYAGRWEEEMVTLEYDAGQAIRELHATGLYDNAPIWCRITELLLQGFPLSHGAVLGRAMQLCEKETGACRWPDIPEIFMERALVELGIPRWFHLDGLSELEMPFTAKYVLKHYLETGQKDQDVYCGTAEPDGVRFTPLREFN